MADFQHLIGMLQSKDPDKRFEACEKLRVATNIPPEALEALRSVANDTNLDVADAAQRAIKLHSPDIGSLQAEKDTSTGEKEAKAKNINREGLFFGILGALIGAIPVSIVKTMSDFQDYGFCQVLGDEHKFPIQLSTCGIYYFTWKPEYLWLYCIFVLLGGALFGFLGAGIGLKRFQEKNPDATSHEWKGLFGWSFIAGIIFDILFVYLFMWPGY
jgi:hypothetical protein